MRHAQHLGAFAQIAQLPADNFGHRAAYACVHLVEHHAQGVRLGGGGHLHGETDARQLAA